MWVWRLFCDPGRSEGGSCLTIFTWRDTWIELDVDGVLGKVRRSPSKYLSVLEGEYMVTGVVLISTLLDVQQLRCMG
jgi:hypothetical protein